MVVSVRSGLYVGPGQARCYEHVQRPVRENLGGIRSVCDQVVARTTNTKLNVKYMRIFHETSVTIKLADTCWVKQN